MKYATKEKSPLEEEVGKRKQINSSTNARLLWSYMLHLFLLPLWCALLSLNVNLLPELCITTAGALFLPLLPACSSAERRAGSSGKCRVIKALQCCVSTQRIKNFSKFLSCSERGISSLQIDWIYGKSVHADVFIPPCFWLCFWQVLGEDLQKQQIFARMVEISEDYIGVTVFYHLYFSSSLIN